MARETAAVARSAASAAGVVHAFKTRPATPQAEFLAGAAEASGREGNPRAAAISARGRKAMVDRKMKAHESESTWKQMRPRKQEETVKDMGRQSRARAQPHTNIRNDRCRKDGRCGGGGGGSAEEVWKWT